MKVSTLIIFICVAVLSIGFGISSFAFSRIAVLEKDKEILILKQDMKKYKTQSLMRDDILQAIKIQVPFKNIGKIKLKIDEWETLKEMEKVK